MVSGSKRLVNSGSCLWPEALIVWGPGSQTAQHAHNCVQLILALTGGLRVRGRVRDSWRHCRAVVVHADVDHEVDAGGALVLTVFIAAESTLGAAVAAHRVPDLDVVSNAEAARWRAALGDPNTLNAARVIRWVSSRLMRNSATPRTDPRVERVIRMLRTHPLDARSTSLVRLSTIAGLSPSRFAHVFTAAIGIPLRPYMRWLRLQRAARELVSGRSVTQAAHIAGFSDAAHLTRTFRRMLGSTPRDLIRRAPPARAAQDVSPARSAGKTNTAD
jgi:AraC-like DNA-binding protein